MCIPVCVKTRFALNNLEFAIKLNPFNLVVLGASRD